VFFNSVNVKEADLLRVSLFFSFGIHPILQYQDFIYCRAVCPPGWQPVTFLFTANGVIAC
jgi:hypothetical protein